MSSAFIRELLGSRIAISTSGWIRNAHSYLDVNLYAPPEVRRVIQESLVEITVNHLDRKDKGGGFYRGGGTGFVVRDGEGNIRVLTSFHIPADEVKEHFYLEERYLKIIVYDGISPFSAQIVGRDKDSDLLLLKVSDTLTKKFTKKPLVLSRQEFQENSTGPWFAFGFPGNDFKPRMIVFSRFLRYSREEDELGLKHKLGIFSGLVEHGFSGGPILGRDGECYGITFAIGISKFWTIFIPSDVILEFLHIAPLVADKKSSQCCVKNF